MLYKYLQAVHLIVTYVLLQEKHGVMERQDMEKHPHHDQSQSSEHIRMEAEGGEGDIRSHISNYTNKLNSIILLHKSSNHCTINYVWENVLTAKLRDETSRSFM